MPTSTRRGVGPSWVAGHVRSLWEWRLTPLRITVEYLVFGFAALYVSDVLLVTTLAEPLLSQVQAVKAAAEVLATGGLIFLLTRHSRTQLRRTNQALQRQREELDVLHRILRHNLRNALTVIAGRAELLLSTGDLSSDEEVHAVRIEAATERLVDLVERASRIRRVTENEGRLVTVDLPTEIQTVVENHPSLPAGVDLRTDLPETAAVSVNHLFTEAVGELIDNAIAYNESERPRLEIAVDPDAGPRDCVEVTVADDGPGVDEHVRAVFDRAELDQLLHLDGMGLWFVYWTVTDGGGTFAIEDNEWGGTTVRLTLPKPAAASVAADGAPHAALTDAANG